MAEMMALPPASHATLNMGHPCDDYNMKHMIGKLRADWVKAAKRLYVWELNFQDRARTALVSLIQPTAWSIVHTNTVLRQQTLCRLRPEKREPSKLHA